MLSVIVSGLLKIFREAETGGADCSVEEAPEESLDQAAAGQVLTLGPVGWFLLRAKMPKDCCCLDMLLYFVLVAFKLN